MPKEMSVFTSNSHSNHVVTWKPVAPEVSALVKDLLDRVYRLDHVANVQQVGGWEVMSKNFRVSFVGNWHDDVLLKRHIQNANPTALWRVNGMMTALSHAGVKVPRTISAVRSGSGEVVQYDNSYWELFPYVSGSYYQGTIGELESATVEVARLNMAMKNLPMDGTIPPLRALLTHPHWRRFVAGDEGTCTALDMFLEESADFVSSQIEAIESDPRGSSPAMMSEQVLHTDLHPHNFIFENGEVQAILDFGNVKRGPVGVDIGKACHRLVRQFVLYHKKPWQETLEEGVKLFLDTYCVVNRSALEELRILPNFMRNFLLRNLNGCLSHHYDKKDWSHDVTLKEAEKQIGLLAEVDCFEPIFKEYFG